MKPLKFKKGGLHKSLGIKAGKKIPKKAFKAALSGKKGKKAKKEALFKKNVLTGPMGNRPAVSKAGKKLMGFKK